MKPLTNSAGNFRTTVRAIMRAFDKLPMPVRVALSESVADWAPQPILRDYRSGVRVSGILAAIKDANARELTKREGERQLAIGRTGDRSFD